MSSDSSDPPVGVSRQHLTPAPTPPRKQPWGPFAAIVVTLLNYLVSNVGAALLVGFLLVGIILPAIGVSSEQFRNVVGGSLEQFSFVFAAEAAALACLWFFMRYRKIRLADIGLGRGPRWSDLGWAIGTFFCYFGTFIVVGIIVQLLGVNTEQKQDLGVDTVGQSALGLCLMFIALVVLPPIAEEVMFRGFLFSGLRRAWRIVPAILFTSLLFGSLHLFGGFRGEGLLWVAGIDTFVLSLFLCYVRYKTTSLWSPILVHALKNSMAFIALFILHQA